MWPGKIYDSWNWENSQVLRREDLLRCVLAVNPQASSTGKPVSWNGFYLCIAEVQLCDIKSAKTDIKKKMCVERQSSKPAKIVRKKGLYVEKRSSVSKVCDYQRGTYVLTVYLSIPGLSGTYHCTQNNRTTTRSMPEHPLTNSHSHHSKWGQSSLTFQAWICWVNRSSTRAAELDADPYLQVTVMPNWSILNTRYSYLIYKSLLHSYHKNSPTQLTRQWQPP